MVWMEGGGLLLTLHHVRREIRCTRLPMLTGCWLVLAIRCYARFPGSAGLPASWDHGVYTVFWAALFPLVWYASTDPAVQ